MKGKKKKKAPDGISTTNIAELPSEIIIMAVVLKDDECDEKKRKEKKRERQ